MRVAKTPFFFAALIGVSSPVLADDSCAPMIFDTNDCLVGNWVGTNTIAERMQAMLGTLAPAGVSRQVFPDDFARVMGMVIYPDGFYATLPFHSSLTMHDLEDGELTITDMDLAVSSNFGWIWTAGTALRFCALEGSSAMLSMDVSSPGGNASASFDPSAAPNNYMPDITYSCAGDTFSMTIALPAPIGPVDHFFTRIPDARFDEEMFELYESRFAPAEGED